MTGNKRFHLFVLINFINNVGTYSSYIAFMAIAQKHGMFVNSASTLLAVMAIGSLVGWILTNKYLHNFEIHRVQIVASFASAIIVLGIILNINSWAFMLIGIALLGASENIYNASYYTNAKSILNKNELHRINSWLEISGFVGMFLGAAMSGIIIDSYGSTFALLIDHLSYLCVAGITIYIGKSVIKKNEEFEVEKVSLRSLIKLKNYKMLFVFVISLLTAFTISGYNVLEMPFFIEILGLTYFQASLVFSSSLLGILVFYFVSNKAFYKNKATLFAISFLLALDVVLIIWGMQKSVVITTMLIVVFACSISIIHSSVRNYIHDKYDNPALLVRIFSTVRFGNMLLSILGMIVVPGIVHYVGVQFGFTVLGILSLLFLFTVLLVLKFYEKKMRVI